MFRGDTSGTSVGESIRRRTLPLLMMGHHMDMAKASDKQRQLPCLDQSERDEGLSGTLAYLESENRRLKTLVVQLSATIIRNVVDAK